MYVCFVKKANIVHNNQYDYSKVEYKQRELKVEIICLKGHHFFQTPTKHLLGRGCPTCKNSSGEAQITKILLDMKVKYETQAMFDKCRGPESGRKLKFDFYIPNYNLLIEFDGMQHFQPVSFGADKETAEERFAKQLVRDHTKEEFCKLENIRLLRLDYRDNINTWKQNIEDKMRCI